MCIATRTFACCHADQVPQDSNNCNCNKTSYLEPGRGSCSTCEHNAILNDVISLLGGRKEPAATPATNISMSVKEDTIWLGKPEVNRTGEGSSQGTPMIERETESTAGHAKDDTCKVRSRRDIRRSYGKKIKVLGDVIRDMKGAIAAMTVEERDTLTKAIETCSAKRVEQEEAAAADKSKEKRIAEMENARVQKLIGKDFGRLNKAQKKDQQETGGVRE